MTMPSLGPFKGLFCALGRLAAIASEPDARRGGASPCPGLEQRVSV